MKLLFTGFGAFPGIRWNPSLAVAQHAALAAAERGVLAESLELAVTFDAVRQAADVLETRADLIVHVGVARSRHSISVERTAVNMRAASPDAAGAKVARPGALERDASDRVSALPLEGLVSELAERWSATPVELSDDAGTYVCNATLFHGLGKRTPRVFVHVPLIDEDDATVMGKALGESAVAWWTAVAGGTA